MCNQLSPQRTKDKGVNPGKGKEETRHERGVNILFNAKVG